MSQPAPTRSRLRQQRGAALLALIVLVVLGLIAFMLSGFLDQHRPQVRVQEAQQRMGEARDALVAFAISEWCADPASYATPQQALPCIADGTSDGAETACGRHDDQIGRLPWRTLGTKPLRDDAGECFWYTRFGDLTSPPLLPDQIVARIHAPGVALEDQARPAASSGQCGAHDAQYDYLEPPGPVPGNDIVLDVTYASFVDAQVRCGTSDGDGDDGGDDASDDAGTDDGNGGDDAGDDGSDDTGNDGGDDAGDDGSDDAGDDSGDDGGSDDGGDGGDDGAEPVDCEANAQVLLDNIAGRNNSCRVMPGNNPSAACQAAADALAGSGCSCASQAPQFIQPPCINNLNSPQCRDAVEALEDCS